MRTLTPSDGLGDQRSCRRARYSLTAAALSPGVGFPAWMGAGYFLRPGAAAEAGSSGTSREKRSE